MLLTIFTAVGTLTISSSYAQLSCPNCELDDPRVIANQLLIRDLPLSLWIDKSTYAQGDTIKVQGHVASVISGSPVTLTVRNSLNSVIAIDQITVDENGDFKTTFNTGGSLWKHSGDYRIKANYGSSVKSNQVLFEMIGGMGSQPAISECGEKELSVKNYCVPYTIKGGTVTGVSVNAKDKSLIIMINAINDGTITLNPSKKVLDGA
ncbi:MAG: PEFG-CTERM domain-containing protein, partial [Nitrosopumilus sp.]|nr:PEFG-CTERM domain-containing protein [Nitrosopumilus sp.]